MPLYILPLATSLRSGLNSSTGRKTAPRPSEVTRVTVSETDVVRDIRSDYKYGFSNPDEAKDYFFKSGRGLSHEVVEAISSTRTSPTGCASSATSRSTTSSRVRCRPGAATSPRSTSTTSTTTSGRPRSRPTSGRTCRPRSSTPGTSSASPRRRRSTSPASAPSTSPRSSTTSSRRTSRRKGVIFLDMDSALREHEDIVKQYMGTIIPQNDNKFAALNSAVWSGGSFIYVPPGVHDRDAAPGLLPHQRGEHGPVRAHADHRRRGRLRALRRGLHRADLLVRLAALGGRRDHRQAGRALPLHDDPELVEQRLQPRHQARGRLRGRDDGVGRRQPRLEADDEVPGDLADGRARARRGALDRVRRQGPAPGRGRQGASMSRRTRRP